MTGGIRGSPEASAISTALAARSNNTPMTNSTGEAPDPGTSSAIGARYGISATGAPSTMVSSPTSTTPAVARRGMGCAGSKPRKT